MADYSTLRSNEYASGVTTHSDILSPRPVVISRERARKVGKPKQNRMRAQKAGDCLACNPERLDGKPRVRDLCGGRVGAFENAAPYLPFAQHVLFVKHSDPRLTMKVMHITQMQQIRKFDLYYLLASMVQMGKEFANQPIRNTDLPRMIAGLNIGPMAGQSLPHIHAQYGWEVVLDKRNVSETLIRLYYEELTREDLILHHCQSGSLDCILLVPWTPRGQYHVSLHFPRCYEIHKLGDEEIKAFAYIGHYVLKRYHALGIHNLNIVFRSSPHAREIEPVIVDFIPRVNVPALYEFLGRDVVDTPPSTIFNAFVSLSLRSIAEDILAYDPDRDYENTAGATSAKSVGSEREQSPSVTPDSTRITNRTQRPRRASQQRIGL